MNNRLLSKLAPVRKVGGGSEHRTAVYTPVHEDSSTEPTNKFSAGVEFGKKSNKPAFAFLAFSGIITIMSIFFGLYFGAVHIDAVGFIQLMLGTTTATTKAIIFQIRLPEVLNAFVVGGLLALAGMLMQVLLQNPLADPYILGVSGGAAVATLIGMLLGLSLFWLHSLAYLGALLSIILVFCLARSPKHWSPIKLLLIGVVLAAGWGAIISFILSVSPNNDLNGLLFWLIGNISNTSFSYSGSIILLFCFFICMFLSKPLDLLLLGNLRAKTLGVNVQAVYVIIYLLSALLTATAVSIAGTIGFVGLIVPHIIRLCIGSSHKFLTPAVILVGGSLLVLADLLARTIMSPLQLPVGIFTVFIGVPVFLFLLFKNT